MDFTPATNRAIEIKNSCTELILAPYQIEGIDYLTRDGVDAVGRILGHDPGLGKTAQAILAGAGLGLQRVLILCPAAVIYQWQSECLRWAGFKPVIIQSPRDTTPKTGWVICAYSRVKALEDFAGRWDALILDEFHYLKDPKTLRTKAVWGQKRRPGVRHYADRIWLLSGTPIPNRVRELAHICCALRPRWFPSYTTFLKHFCWSATEFYYGHAVEKYDGATNTEELRHKLLASKLLHRKRKEDVMTELPAKRRDTVPLALDLQAVKALTEKINAILPPARQEAILEAVAEGHTLPNFDEFSRVRSLIGEAKAASAADWIVEQAQGNKLVAFCHHLNVGRIIKTALAELGIPVWFASGEQFPEERQAMIAEFNRASEGAVFIGTIGACGTGLNGLQETASRAIFVEASYVPGQNTQAEDRLHRIGQKMPVLVQYLFAPVAMDDHLVKLVAAKAANISSVLD